MAYLSRLFGSLIWIIRGYHIALQHLVTYMLSLERSRWGVEKVPQTAIQRHQTNAQGVASGNPQQKTPSRKSTSWIRTTRPQLQNPPVSQRRMPRKHSARWRKGARRKPKKTYDKIDAATTEAADLIKNSYSKAAKGMQDYNNKIIEFAHANTNAAFDFVQKLSGVKSPTAFVELWTEHARKQVETLTEQSKQLAVLGQKVTRATAEPLKTGVSIPFNIAA